MPCGAILQCIMFVVHKNKSILLYNIKKGFTAMKFEKVNLSEIPQNQRASNYSGLHDAITAMPFSTGDKPEGLAVTFEDEKSENNARNSVRSFAKSNKALFTIKTEKLKETDKVKFGFLIKKFAPSPVKEVAKKATETTPSTQPI